MRLYTFIWTMYDVMEGAKLCFSNEQHSTSILVLDRPNPLGGVQGALYISCIIMSIFDCLLY